MARKSKSRHDVNYRLSSDFAGDGAVTLGIAYLAAISLLPNHAMVNRRAIRDSGDTAEDQASSRLIITVQTGFLPTASLQIREQVR
jgi:hypothetical protein